MHEHRHSDEHHHGSSVKNIRVAFFLNISFTIIEIVGGFLTNSLAILSDALHDLGDSIALGLSWRLEQLSTRERSLQFTYGYRRFSLLGAVISSLILITGSIFIVSKAVPRLLSPATVHTGGMLGLAILGVIINGAAVLRLKGGKKIHERVVMLHLLEDVFGWVAVLVVSIIIRFTGLYFLDPLLSLCIALYVLVKVFSKLVQAMRIFLQSIPENIEADRIKEAIRKVENVIDVHDIHAWSLDGEYNVGTLHVVVSQEISINGMKKIKEEIRTLMHTLGLHHATIEIETEDEVCDYTYC